MGWQLHDTHSHSHGGTSAAAAAGSRRSSEHHHHTENINVRAAFIHVVGDVLQSVGVFIAALVIYFIPSWKLADPICTFVFSIVVLATTITILKDTLLVSVCVHINFSRRENSGTFVELLFFCCFETVKVLMEGTPTYLDYTEIKSLFLDIDGVKRVHNLRVWGLSIDKVAMSAHLAIGKLFDIFFTFVYFNLFSSLCVDTHAVPEEVLRMAIKRIHAQYSFFETTLQIERFEDEMEECTQCVTPIDH